MKHDFSILKLPFEPDRWVDADYRLFEACFAILGQFVCDELDLCTDQESSHRGYRLHSADNEAGDNPERVAIDLWLWYTEDLPKLEEAYALDLAQCYSSVPREKVEYTASDVYTFHEYRVSELATKPKYPYDYPETVKDEKLAELIAIRRSLWT